MSAPVELSPSLPVVVLQHAGGHWQHGVLGIARTLGRLGVAVHVLQGDGRAPIAASRFVRDSLLPYPVDASEEAVVDVLLRFADDHGPAVLIPTDDESALLVDEHAGTLAAGFRFQAQPPGLARALSDKLKMSRLCAEHEVPTPWTRAVRGLEEARAIAAEVRFPLMVKTIDGSRVVDGTRERMRIVRDAEELLRACEDLDDPEVPNLIAQEYIPGGPDSVWMFNGYFDGDSECRVAVTGRKLRQFPPYTGVTTLGVCLPNPEVDASTRRLMKRTGYRGALDIGFRYDARDGRYKLLDVNPRVGATFRLFAGENGMDVVRALYLDLTGQPIPPLPPLWGRKWLVENFDAASSIAYRRAGELSAREWIGSLRGVEELAWFARDDPMPFLRMTVRSGARAASRLRRRWATAAQSAET